MDYYALYHNRAGTVLAYHESRTMVELYQRLHKLKHSTTIYPLSIKQMNDINPFTSDWDCQQLIDLREACYATNLPVATTQEHGILSFVANSDSRIDIEYIQTAIDSLTAIFALDRQRLKPLSKKESKHLRKALQHLRTTLDSIQDVYTLSSLYTIVRAKPSDTAYHYHVHELYHRHVVLGNKI